MLSVGESITSYSDLRYSGITSIDHNRLPDLKVVTTWTPPPPQDGTVAKTIDEEPFSHPNDRSFLNGTGKRTEAQNLAYQTLMNNIFDGQGVLAGILARAASSSALFV